MVEIRKYCVTGENRNSRNNFWLTIFKSFGHLGDKFIFINYVRETREPNSIRLDAICVNGSGNRWLLFQPLQCWGGIELNWHLAYHTIILATPRDRETCGSHTQLPTCS